LAVAGDCELLALTPHCGLASMCEKCLELDRRVSHLRTLIANVTDSQTIAAMNVMIEKIEAEKVALHSAE
jgi:hypothetical protein